MGIEPQTKTGRLIVRLAMVAAGFVTLVGAYKTFDLPIPAWAEDINRLEKQQVDTAIEVYQNKYRSFLALPRPKEAIQQRAWEIEVDRSLKQLERAEQRKIELSK